MKQWSMAPRILMLCTKWDSVRPVYWVARNVFMFLNTRCRFERKEGEVLSGGVSLFGLWRPSLLSD